MPLPYPDLYVQLLCIPDLARLSGLKGAPSARDPAASPDASIPFEVTFEEAMDRLSQLPGAFTELDGFFLLHGREDSHSWQLSGMIYDRPMGAPDVACESRVCWCELKGACPLPSWKELIRCFETPEERIVAYLPHESFFRPLLDLERLWDQASS